MKNVANVALSALAGLSLVAAAPVDIEKRNMAGLSYMKTSRTLAEKLLGRDPQFYDAYLAVGVENYLLGITPAP